MFTSYEQIYKEYIKIILNDKDYSICTYTMIKSSRNVDL